MHGTDKTSIIASQSIRSYFMKELIFERSKRRKREPTLHAHNAGCVLDPALVASNSLDRRSTTEIPQHQTPGRTNLQFRFNDQHPVRRSSGEIPNYGLSLQHVHAQDAGQFQVGHCRIHDFLRIRALRQVGFSHRRSAIARCISAVQMASHEERLSNLGRFQDQVGGSSPGASRIEGLSLGSRYVSPDQPRD